METSIRDVFLSMQFPPVDEIVATSKTGKNSLLNEIFESLCFSFFVAVDFRTIRKSRRSCFRSCKLKKFVEKL